MKVFLLLIFLSCFSSRGGTNQPPIASSSLFDFGPSQVRPFSWETGLSIKDTPAAPALETPELLAGTNEVLNSQEPVKTAPLSDSYIESDNVSLATEASPFEIEAYHRLEKQGYFTRPARPSDNLFENAYDPAVVHWGKVDIKSPFITAIKRKNPLALLNWVVFEMSW